LTRKVRRDRISFRIRDAISPSRAESGRSRKKVSASPTGRAVTPAIPFPPTVTLNASFFSRAPPHARHGRLFMYRESSSRTSSESVSRKRRSRLFTTPSNGRLNEKRRSPSSRANRTDSSPEPKRMRRRTRSGSLPNGTSRENR
jgi:hypothetical protein